MIRHFLILLLLNIHFGFSQTKVCVIDMESKQKIPYTLVRINSQKSIGFTDSLGCITLHNFLKTDTLELDQMGYVSKIVIGSTLKINESNSITLRKNIVHIPEVVVIGQKPLQMQTDKTNKARGYSKCMGSDYYQIAKKIELDSLVANGAKINSVSFFIGKGKAHSKFMIKLYAHDTLNNQPGAYLFEKAIIVSSKRKNKWAEFNLDSLNIRINQPIVYVAMEWITGNPDNYWDETYTSADGRKRTSTYYGQVLGLASTNDLEYFIKSSTSKEWSQMSTTIESLSHVTLPNLSPMISVAYTIYK